MVKMGYQRATQKNIKNWIATHVGTYRAQTGSYKGAMLKGVYPDPQWKGAICEWHK